MSVVHLERAPRRWALHQLIEAVRSDDNIVLNEYEIITCCPQVSK